MEENFQDNISTYITNKVVINTWLFITTYITT